MFVIRLWLICLMYYTPFDLFVYIFTVMRRDNMLLVLSGLIRQHFNEKSYNFEVKIENF